jgi:serine/tyrosine/threonine adenylyltransferase
MVLTTLKGLAKSASFTQYLPPDERIPTIIDARKAPEQLLRVSRLVNGCFTWIRPEVRQESRLVAVSEPAMKDLGLIADEAETELFKQTFSGEYVFEDESSGVYPWAQAYSGWQFGSWAGQLGDGRAISLFEGTNPNTSKRYEVQLKGAGLTPYSRFADGKAVLRSSIREFLGSEAVNSLGIPTSRALALVALPQTKARREMTETCAVVTRLAETFVRIGTFDLLGDRKKRSTVRELADYCIKEVFGGENKLVAPKNDGESGSTVYNNRYVQMYREIVRRNARTTALCQAYGFMNGVLNTDNTSIYGLSIDYGPFSFMDTFESRFTPNHDDAMGRYSYKNTPTITWWNLVRLGETLGELLGAGTKVDETSFVEKAPETEELNKIFEVAEKVIEDIGEEYKEVFLETYNDKMAERLGFKSFHSADHENLYTTLLDLLEECELEYNAFFRKLGGFPLFGPYTKADLERFFPRVQSFAPRKSVKDGVQDVAAWLEKYKARLEIEGSVNDIERQKKMDKVNPKFILKNWVMDEVINDAKNGNYELLEKVKQMALEPFNETWGYDKEFEDKFTGESPKLERDSQCSCSS